MNIVFFSGVSRKISGNLLTSEPLGGTQSAMLHLAEAFAGKGHQVTIFANCEGNEGVFQGVNYQDKHKLLKFSQEKQIDFFIPVASESVLKLKIAAKRTIIWLHNDYSLYWHNELQDLAAGISASLLKYADKLVVTSNWQKEVISDTFKIPENHLRIIPNGVKIELFQTFPTVRKKQLIYTSVPDRGLDLLLRFFPLLAEKEPDLTLQVYSSFKTWGKNDSRLEKLEAEIKNTTRHPAIFFHEPLPAPLLSERLAESFLWVYPNHEAPQTGFFAETFCISALEALAAGLPILTSKRGALPELVENGQEGFLLDGDPYSQEYQQAFCEKVFLLLNDQQLQQRFSLNARKRAEKYNLSLIVAEWENLFAELLVSPTTTKVFTPLLTTKFTAPLVSVIIPTFNRAANLFHCLNSLKRQSFSAFEVIIADDGSTDQTKAVVDLFRPDLNLRYLFGGENQGFRAARIRNLGLAKARGELVIFLDSDLVVGENFITAHVQAHQKYDRVLVNSYVYRMKADYPEDLGQPPEEYLARYEERLNPDSRDRYALFERGKPLDEGYFLDSNALSIKFQHIGNSGFDSDFVGWGFEDTELGYRFAGKGFQFLFIKENCFAYHLFHESSPEKEQENPANWEKLKNKYKLKKWYQPLPEIGVTAGTIIENVDWEKFPPFYYQVTARKVLKTGEKFGGFSGPLVRIFLEDGIITDIED